MHFEVWSCLNMFEDYIYTYIYIVSIGLNIRPWTGLALGASQEIARTWGVFKYRKTKWEKTTRQLSIGIFLQDYSPSIISETLQNNHPTLLVRCSLSILIHDYCLVHYLCLDPYVWIVGQPSSRLRSWLIAPYPWNWPGHCWNAQQRGMGQGWSLWRRHGGWFRNIWQAFTLW